MRCKKTALVINPRTGQNVAQLPSVLAVLAAAGWKTDIALKEYGGHSMELAQRACKDGSDLILAYGGDGTLNQVVNGVMHGEKQRSVIGVIPGGTANLWAGDVGVPSGTVEASLSLINSEVRKVDVGRVAVQSVEFPDSSKDNQSKQTKKKAKALKSNKKARDHFLLMAGLGFDAAVMRGVSKPLKYQVGPLAVGLSVVKELPDHQSFPVEIHALNKDGSSEPLWRGEALQVIIGNTRRYAMVMETTPDAYIDDGMLDVCIITAGDPLSTMQQVSALLLRRPTENTSTERLRGARLAIKVPATVPLQVDGSAVKLKDYLDKSTATKLQQVEALEQVMVTYRFDALPRVLGMAIPCTYNEELFEKHLHEHKHTDLKDFEPEHSSKKKEEKEARETAFQKHTAWHETQPEQVDEKMTQPTEIHKNLPESAGAFLRKGRRVSVIGKVPDPERKQTYIVAGCTQKQSTGEEKPVAVIVNEKTHLFNAQGEALPIDAMHNVYKGSALIVEGKKNRRGVIQATQVVL